MNSKLPVLALGALVCAPSLAHADTLSPGSGSYGSITRIGRGVKELSLETGVTFSQRTDKEKGILPQTSSTSFALLGGAVFRYFVADNVMVGLHAGGFFRSVADKQHALSTTVNGAQVTSAEAERKSSEAGFLGTLTASYYASLGGGLFIAPLVGVGGFAGTSSATVTTSGVDSTDKASIAGVALRGGLGLVFYASSRFNLFARPEANIYIGSSKPKSDAGATSGTSGSTTAPESRGFTRIDGGFTCGLSYVF